ncbi:MAG: sulfotransferase family protein [Nocardioides sp.]
MPASQSDRHLVLVAGTGRSGTSTLVGVLQRHGIHVPQPEVAPDDSNPRGFGEPRWVVELHGRLLRQGKVQVADSRPAAWDLAADLADADTRARVRRWLEEQFAVADRLVVKDPRILWFLPLWTEAARELGVEPSFVTMLRPPPETVGSRRTYYNRGLEDPHGIASWLNLMTGTEHATRGHRRAFVRYHDLLDDWAPELDQLWRRTGLGDAPPAASEDPGEFIDPGLRRMRMTWDDLELPDRLQTLAAEASDCLDALATGEGDEDPAVLARLDEARASYAAYYAEAESVAHSSVIAARQSARSAPPASSKPAPSGTPQPWPTRRGLASAVADKLPASVRRKVPAQLKARVRRRTDGR